MEEKRFTRSSPKPALETRDVTNPDFWTFRPNTESPAWDLSESKTKYQMLEHLSDMIWLKAPNSLPRICLLSFEEQRLVSIPPFDSIEGLSLDCLYQIYFFFSVGVIWGTILAHVRETVG